MPRERWMDKLDELCNKCKYEFDTWCRGRKCEGCDHNRGEYGMCLYLTVRTANCPYFTPKE